MRFALLILMLSATPAFAMNCNGGAMRVEPNGTQSCRPLTQAEIDQRAVDATKNQERRDKLEQDRINGTEKPNKWNAERIAKQQQDKIDALQAEIDALKNK